MAAPLPVKPRASRRKRFLVYWLPGLIAFYTLFGFFAVPLIIRKVIVPQVQKRLNATITLEKAYTNPFSFWLTLQKLEVKDLAGERVFAFDRFDANFQTLDTIFSRGWHFGEVKVVNPFVRGRIESDGSNTFAKLVKPVPVDPKARPEEPLRKIPRLVVRDLAVEGGSIEFKDLSTPKRFERTIHGAAFHISNVDTRPDYLNPMRIEFSTDEGARITWTGSLQANPLTSKGEIEVVGIVASRWMPYAMRYTDIALEGAKVSAKLSYEFAPVAAPRVVKVHVSTATVEQPKLVVPWQEAFEGRADAGAELVTVTDLRIDADARSVSIAQVGVEGGESLFELSKGPTLPERVGDALLSEPRSEPDAKPVETTSRPDLNAIPYPIVRLLTGLRQLILDVRNPWTVELTSIDVSGHRHSFADLSAPEAVRLATSGVTLHAGPIRSVELFKTPFRLRATVQEKGKVDIEGTVEPLARKIEGTIEGTDLNAAAASPYIPASALSPLPPARLGNSMISLKGSFRAELPPAGGARTGWTGRTVLAPLSFVSNENKELVLGAKSLDIVSEATLDTSADADIDIAWKGTIKGEAFAASAPLPQTGLTKASIGSLEIDGGATLKRASAGAVAIAFSGTARLGGVDASAAEAFGPITAGLGEASYQGDLLVNAAPGTDPVLTLKGSSTVSGVKAKAERFGEGLIAVGNAKIESFTLNTKEKSVAASLAQVDGLTVTGNVPMLPPEGFTKQPPGEKRKFTLAGFVPFTVAIDRFELKGSSIDLTDSSTVPPTVIAAEEITVTAAPFSTAGGVISDVSVAAKVNNSGRFALAGTLDAFKDSPAANVKVELTTIPLPPYSGPTGRFLGYQMAEGRMTTRIPIQIADNQMKGEIDFAFDRLKLGERVKSLDAIDAPLELGLALLRDSNDQIKSKIPISGDISDPKFSLSGVIWQAFTGLLVKAATAPFQILGAIFGGNDTDLSQIAFAPGSAELTPEAISSLDILAKGMSERPGIKLRVRGQYEQKSDSVELRRQILREGYAAAALGKGKPARELSEAQLKEQTMIAFDALRQEQARSKGEPAPPSVRRVGSDVPAPPPLDEMEKALIEAMKLSEERITELLQQRGAAVMTFLVKEKQIEAARVQIAEPDPSKRTSEKPRAAFEMF
ncbi:MAG: DUF748 domain-containing protein [Phycisphaerales bacterium]|nr:DUF748 domain-containing protein [Phycisphaerales bacterium]